jgi:hypothetical protein
VLLNPVRFRDVARTLLGSVRADKGFGAQEMVELAGAMRKFSPSSSEFTTVPIGNIDYPVEGIGSTVKWDPVKSEKLFRALRDDKPLAVHRHRTKAVVVDVAPQQIQVQVENATMTAGLGRKADAALRATGFATTNAPVDAADRTAKRTLVLYDPRWDRSAKSLATAVPGAQMQAVPGQGAVLKVRVGPDYSGVRRVRAEDPYEGEFGALTGDEVVCP